MGMKMRKVVIFVLVLVTALIAGCIQNAQQNPVGSKQVGKVEGGKNSTGAIKQLVYQVPKGKLTNEEKNGILYIREEEKLARDVYQTLYEKWGLQIFSNIAKSEQRHMDAVKLLIEKYGLSDPVKGMGVGEFSNPEFSELYSKLTAEGNKSVVDALKVGALIEEKDIVDLQKYISETNKEDIKVVYENLMKGSRNHLRAFVSMLEKYGVKYKPQYLSIEEYNSIVNSPTEKGSI